MPYNLHVISHTHWDREWYMPFETHRLRLVDLIDLLLDIFDNEPEYRHFHLDGQAIVLEDYLQVRPEREGDLRRAAAEGKLSLGPWYVLQDEFLTSGEANVRNMMAGMKLAKRFGEPCMVGYLPDAFGNLGQMPQILRGFGIGNAVFGRGINAARGAGVPPAEAGGQAGETPAPREAGYKSELTWRAPDGSEVLGVFMANWYSNAMDIPADPDEATAFMVARRDATASLATTSQLLMMNGCDHTPTRRDVGRIIRELQGRLGEDTITHSTFVEYLSQLSAEVGDLQVHEGEMRSEYTDGWGVLANTLSARLYQKRANFECQALYEKWVEPLSAFAWATGAGHPGNKIWYGWRTLMQNHPHDSICGCSCDAVHREMDIRFDKVRQVGDTLQAEAGRSLAGAIDTSWVAEGQVPVVVMNPLPYARTETVRVTVDFPQDCDVSDIEVVSGSGACVPCRVVQDHGVVWDCWLPADRFRETFHARRLTIELLAAGVPGCGYRTYAVRPIAGELQRSEMALRGNVLENGFLRVEIARDGTLTVRDKLSGAVFAGLNVYEDAGDVGDEYIYRAPEGDVRVSTAGAAANIELFRRPTGDQVAEISQSLEVPRRGSDSRHVDTVGIGTQVFLGAQARHVEVYVTIANAATDHRLRALFPTDLQAEVASADGQFDIVQRRITPTAAWVNPDNSQPQQAFVDVSDDKHGLTVANRGLPEYEILRDGHNTIALTLLRCVGRLGDWGDFPTPEAQCLGEQRAAYAIIAHGGSIDQTHPWNPAALAYQYVTPMWGMQASGPAVPASEAILPPVGAFISLRPPSVVLSSIKKAEESDSLIVRIYNPFTGDASFTLGCLWTVREAYLVNLAEERQEPLAVGSDGVRVKVGAKKIVTVELVLG